MHQRRFARSPSLASHAIVLALAVLIPGTGAANAPEYQFTRSLPNPSAASGDQFGYSVAFVGANLLVGAPFVDMGGTDAGAAYLFDGKTGELLLTFQAPEPAAGDWFGISVAGVGNNVLVGALGVDTPVHDAGAAYLFDGKTGELLRTFQKPTPLTDDWFGGAVAGMGENVLVGAPLDDAGAVDAGAAYLFDGKTGALLQTFRNPTPAGGDWFGAPLVGAGDRVLVGAFLDDTAKPNAGAAYLFDATTGTLLHTLQSPSPAADDQFGVSLDLVQGNPLIGSPFDDTGARDAGAAYLFDGATGTLLRRLQSPTPMAGELFGRSVAAAGASALIGAWKQSGARAGAAYLIDPASGSMLQRFQSPTMTDGDALGFAVAATADALLIAAPGDANGTSEGGAAFLFAR